jgi:DNA-binding transcriptional ArsR family regulator
MSALAAPPAPAGTIDFGPAGSIHVSVAVDPLVTVLTSIAELFGPLAGRLPPSFLAQGRQLARSVDLGGLAILWTSRAACLVDFLAPRQVTGVTDLASRLAEIRATPPEQAAADVSAVFAGGCPPAVADWLDEPDRQLARLVDALRSFVDAVVVPLYPGLEQRLRREAMSYAQALVTDGAGPLLLDLHPRISHRDGRLRACHPVPTDVTPAGLVLCPMSCGPRTTFSAVGEATVLAFATGDLAVTGRVRPSHLRVTDPLASLVGASRAAILRALTTPATTTDLANLLRLSPSTVSHHLDALRGSDIVASTRSAQRVYYRLTDRGRQLLELLGTEPLR